MRILITNDDGIDAPGLSAMRDIACELAGSTDDILTAAPVQEQSGTSHSVSFVKPMMISRRGPNCIAVDGTPSDCVLAALQEFDQGGPPDLVLSGVNRGNNSGENAAYSGTVGAALEASLQGIKAIALSQYFGSENRSLPDPFEAARLHGAKLVAELLANAPWGDSPYGLFYNVNFPPCGADRTCGIEAAVRASASDPVSRPHLTHRLGPKVHVDKDREPSRARQRRQRCRGQSPQLHIGHSDAGRPDGLSDS